MSEEEEEEWFEPCSDGDDGAEGQWGSVEQGCIPTCHVRNTRTGYAWAWEKMDMLASAVPNAW